MRQLPAWVENEPEHLRGLLVELHRVRRRGVRGLSTAAPIDNLIKIALLHNSKVSRRSQLALLRFLFDELLPSKLDPNDKRAVSLYFGLAPTSTAHTERRRRENTGAEVFHQGWSTFRQPETGDERRFLVRVAEVLFELGQAAAPVIEPPSARPRVYVRRQEYHDSFRAAMSSEGNRVIVFVGEPGNGKKRLAYECVNEYCRSSESAIYVHADGVHLGNSIQLALARYGWPGEGLSDQEVLRKLAQFIGSSHAPAYLVLYNLEDHRVLGYLAAVQSKTTIVVTSHRWANSVMDAIHIEVGPMLPTEAFSMARQLLPGESDLELCQLVDVAGYAPEAIKAAASLVADADSPVSVDELCRSFYRYVDLIFNQAGSDLIPTVHRIVEGLEREDQLASSLLEHLVMLGDFVSEPLLVDLFTDINEMKPEDRTLGRSLARRTVSRLRAYSLISVESGYIRLSKLGRVVVQAVVLDHRREEVVTRLRRILTSRALEGREQQENSDLTPTWLLVSHLLHIDATTDGEAISEGVARVVRQALGGSEFGSLVSITPRAIFKSGRFLTDERYELNLDSVEMLTALAHEQLEEEL